MRQVYFVGLYGVGFIVTVRHITNELASLSRIQNKLKISKTDNTSTKNTQINLYPSQLLEYEKEIICKDIYLNKNRILFNSIFWPFYVMSLICQK